MVAPQKALIINNTGIQLQDVVDEKVTTLSHGWSGSVAGWRSEGLISTAIAPPMMSLVEDWLNGYRKHALPSPRQWTHLHWKIRHEAFLIMWNRH